MNGLVSAHAGRVRVLLAVLLLGSVAVPVAGGPAVGAQAAAVPAAGGPAAGQPAVVGPALPAAGAGAAPAAGEPAGAGGAPAAPGVPAPTGSYGWPLWPPPPVGRPFQPPSMPYGPGHRGADLVGAAGQPVLAAGAGVVVYAAPLADRGVVSVDHSDGLRTTYEPVLAGVRAGQVVARGQRLGTLAAGHPGCPGPACLHWGLRRERTYLDPLVLVRPARVRLLPYPPEEP